MKSQVKTFLRSFLLAGLLVGTADCVLAQQADKTVVRLDDFKADQPTWRLDLWARAKGTLMAVKDDPSPGQTSLRFAADLSNKGLLARLIKDFDGLALNDTSIIQMKIKSETATTFGVVFKDSTDQTHQRKNIKIEPDNQWHDIEFDPRKIAGGEHFGGANDGKWHGAPKLFLIAFDAKSDEANQKPTISIANVRVVTGISTTPPDAPPPPPAPLAPEQKALNAAFEDFNPGDPRVGGEWVQAIVIKTPELRSEVQGDVKVEFEAPGMTSARVLCWQQPTAADPNPAGHDSIVANPPLDAAGKGSFVFPANKYPNGPINVRILAHNELGQRDFRELQMFNKGGVKWNQGIPKTDPPAAKGMKLTYSDDFDGPLSISNTGQGVKYYSHKPGGGDFSGWRFSDVESPNNPFGQSGTWMRIHASKTDANPKGSTGLISPVRKDGTGTYMTPPFYAECRFTAQSAPGTWPAFWTLTKNKQLGGTSDATDELDVIEAYGGVGPKNPNSPGYYITTHFWKQKGADGKSIKDISKRVDMLTLGNKSYWSHTFHTYAVKVTESDTIYYLDDIEVLRHPTGEVSKTDPAFWMINYAISGISGWKIDLEREGNASDMWVDYVRVYEGTLFPKPVTAAAPVTAVAPLPAPVAAPAAPVKLQEGEIFISDFAGGSPEIAGWKVTGDWKFVDFAKDKPGLENNPGQVMKFPAGNKTGMLSKSFAPLNNPKSLKLTFDAGYGWGKENHSDGLQVMLLDAEGNGYVFDTHRAKAKWGAQWGKVSAYSYGKTLNWSPEEVDTTQKAIVSGGGLRKFTITRDGSGKWSFNGDGWGGATPITFTDNTTTKFSQVVLNGVPNTDDLLYGKVKLEANTK